MAREEDGHAMHDDDGVTATAREALMRGPLAELILWFEGHGAEVFRDEHNVLSWCFEPKMPPSAGPLPLDTKESPGDEDWRECLQITKYDYDGIGQPLPGRFERVLGNLGARAIYEVRGNVDEGDVSQVSLRVYPSLRGYLREEREAFRRNERAAEALEAERNEVESDYWRWRVGDLGSEAPGPRATESTPHDTGSEIDEVPREPTVQQARRFNPVVMSAWISLGADVVRAMLDESERNRCDDLVSLAAFARRVEVVAPRQGLVASEENVRWVWSSLLAHPVLSMQLRAMLKTTMSRALRRMEVLAAGSLLVLELSPGSGLLRSVRDKVRIPNEWALVELRTPLSFEVGLSGHVRCAESACSLAVRPRTKVPDASASTEVWDAWAMHLEAPRVDFCDSLNHAAQQASTLVEQQRRTHSVNVFDHAWWLRDDGSQVALETIRHHVEYWGIDDPEALRALGGRNREIKGLSELLDALGLPPRELLPSQAARAPEATVDGEGMPSRNIRKGMRVRYPDGTVARVLQVTRDGALRVEVKLPGGGVDSGEMFAWKFEMVERDDGSWVPIAFDANDVRERDMWRALGLV